MRWIVVLLFLPLAGYMQELLKPQNHGKVSHEFKKQGCATVVVVDNGSQPPFILIPNTPLPKKLDKNGMKIRFNYRPLRRPNPQGCTQGVPAELSEVQKSN